MESGYLIIGLILVIAGLRAAGSRNVAARLDRIERKLDQTLERLGIDLTQDVDQQVLELARSGRKIEAIKLYREQTGVGLKEAKDYVEALPL